jgi:hypothetical protein
MLDASSPCHIAPRFNPPGRSFLLHHSPPMSYAQNVLVQSSQLIHNIGVPACMASSGRIWPLPAEQRRHAYNGHAELRERAEPSPSVFRHMSRSMSEISPVSPSYDSAARTLQFSPSDNPRRRESRFNTNPYYPQPQAYSDDAAHQTYDPYLAGAAPRSAPSLVTSFPEQLQPSTMRTTPSWPLASSSPSTYNQYHTYSNPVTSFSPVSNNPYDPWQETAQRPRSHTYMASPTSYSYQQQPEAAGQSAQQDLRGYSASSAPGAMQSPLGPNTSGPYGLRRESEAVDEFTSPTEFALFVEATSSLNINATSSAPWTFNPRPAPTATRLAAPLPPLPRSHSSPAPVSRQATRQPSRSQLLAEALGGLDGEGSRPGSPDEDDELPDYAQSQAEAAARQRREAARRAQELDQLWSSARRHG